MTRPSRAIHGRRAFKIAFILWPSRHTSTARTFRAEAELSPLMGDRRHARANIETLGCDDPRAGRNVRHLAKRAGALANETLRHLRERGKRHQPVSDAPRRGQVTATIARHVRTSIRPALESRQTGCREQPRLMKG